MKRILINTDTDSQSKIYLEKMKQCIPNKDKSHLNRLKKLKENLGRRKNKDFSSHIKYMEKIISYYDIILRLHPRYFDIAASHLPIKKDSPKLSTKFKWRSRNKTFADHLVYCMRFDDTCKKLMMPFFHELGIKTCVYCNAQYAITIKNRNDYKATYDIDHFKPKSKYPFLCTSFYNLVPCCSSCNRIKSNKENIDFCLYTDGNEELNPYRFMLSEESLIKYFVNHNNKELSVSLRGTNDEEDPNAKNISEELHLTELYKEHNDTVAQLIWKSIIYNDDYRKKTKETFFKKLPFLDDIEIERLYMGFYTEANDIHKQPLTKLQQDISKQLEINEDI